MNNVFACLVHERQETVVDLVRNLTYLDPDSQILLYNGGRDERLLDRRFSVDGDEPLIHPDPTPQTWGYLHGFAVDVMRFSLAQLSFDTLTIVDSDQLLVRPGYSAALDAFLVEHGPVGMLGNAPASQPANTRVAPAVAAWRERELWLPYCRRFTDGESKFPHWTFWPSTVFTAPACRDLVRTFDKDDNLRDLMCRSKLWATEEIILPTLVALLGHDVVRSPFAYDYVRYRVPPAVVDLDDAMRRRDTYWLHPVDRAPHDRIRRLVRERHEHYVRTERQQTTVRAQVPLTLSILQQAQDIDGWLEDDEADVLIAGLTRALSELQGPHSIVEVGSYCGKATVVLGSVVRALDAPAHIHAVDPHDGRVGALDSRVDSHGSTLDRFEHAITSTGLRDLVTTVPRRAQQTSWDRPVTFLLIDALHDYASVSADFFHFEPWLIDGALVAFHDYADYFPGVTAFVQELLGTGRYTLVARAGTMVLLRRLAANDARDPARPREHDVVVHERMPLVSCIMATYDRPHLVPHAAASFLRQTYPSCELVVVDDGPESVAPLLPDNDRIRHIRVDTRLTIGAKRNLGCDAASGELLANWDDDDWYADWRITYQVEQLNSSGADVCGLQTLLYLDPVRDTAWRYRWPRSARPWVHDASLLFTSKFWARNPFPDTSMGIDCRMLWTSEAKRIQPLDDERFYVGMIHSGNTSPKTTGHQLWTTCSVEEITALVGDDVAFYRDAFTRAAGRSRADAVEVA